MNKKSYYTYFLAFLYILIFKSRPIWERYPGGVYNVFFFILLAILFIWVIIKILQQLNYLFLYNFKLSPIKYLPILILIFSLVECRYNFIAVDFDKIYGKVNFQACYEGTQNQAIIKLRANNQFDIHWTAAFFYDEFFTGTYTNLNDTILLKYRGSKPERLSEKYIKDDKKQLLECIENKNNELNNIDFYYGNCKGYN